jgi:hypothetical protein
LKSKATSASVSTPATDPAVVEVVHLDAPALGPGDDSPFRGGDDMDRLIAERIAARQRDMEEIAERMKASMPPSQLQQQQPLPQKEYDPNEFVVPQQQMMSSPMPMPPSEETRKVRFQEDTDSIFLKLKRKPMADNFTKQL